MVDAHFLCQLNLWTWPLNWEQRYCWGLATFFLMTWTRTRLHAVKRLLRYIFYIFSTFISDISYQILFSHNIKGENFHLAGHSLGSHVMVWDVNVSVKFSDAKTKLLRGQQEEPSPPNRRTQSWWVEYQVSEESRVYDNRQVSPSTQDWILLVPGLWTVPMLIRFLSWLKTFSERFFMTFYIHWATISDSV